jgi:hypothetical protein
MGERDLNVAPQLPPKAVPRSSAVPLRSIFDEEADEHRHLVALNRSLIGTTEPSISGRRIFNQEMASIQFEEN